MIENFEKNEHVLAVKYFHENGKKCKNRKHFILTVLKVDLVKKKFFWDFLPFSWLFWRVLKKLFEKKNENILTPPKKYEIGKKYQKNSTFTLTTLKTDKIKCTPFFGFLPISWFFGGVKKYFGKIMPLRMAKSVTSSGQARDMVLVTNTRFLGMGNHLEPFSEASD